MTFLKLALLLASAISAGAITIQPSGMGTVVSTATVLSEGGDDAAITAVAAVAVPAPAVTVGEPQFFRRDEDAGAFRADEANFFRRNAVQQVERAPASSEMEDGPVVFVDVIPAITTSTVFSTQEVTVIDCGSSTSCPTQSTALVTSIIPVSTTVCPITLTSSYSASMSSSFQWPPFTPPPFTPPPMTFLPPAPSASTPVWSATPSSSVVSSSQTASWTYIPASTESSSLNTDTSVSTSGTATSSGILTLSSPSRTPVTITRTRTSTVTLPGVPFVSTSAATTVISVTFAGSSLTSSPPAATVTPALPTSVVGGSTGVPFITVNTSMTAGSTAFVSLTSSFVAWPNMTAPGYVNTTVPTTLSSVASSGLGVPYPTNGTVTTGLPYPSPIPTNAASRHHTALTLLFWTFVLAIICHQA